MKPRNREVNIFNMSVLDLLTGALGAFCFLTLALFPAYFKSHPSSVADEQAEEEQQRAVQKFGKAKGGLPPFSMAEVSASNDANQACGVFKLDDLKAPRANQSFRQLPFAADTENYKRDIFFFLFDPGNYNVTVTAYATVLPCRINYTQYVSKGVQLGATANLTTSPAPYLFNSEVKPEQLITSILSHR